MAYVDTELTNQPGCWLEAAQLARSVADRLPRPGERMAVVGCGTGMKCALIRPDDVET